MSNDQKINSEELSQAVTVYSRRVISSGLLLQHDKLDADGTTVSIVGPKMAIPGRRDQEQIEVRLNNGQRDYLFPATITNIDPDENGIYRAEVPADVLKRCGITPAVIAPAVIVPSDSQDKVPAQVVDRVHSLAKKKDSAKRRTEVQP